jgi:hypothetical protein
MAEMITSKGTFHAVVFSGVGTALMSLPAASWRTSPSLRQPLATTRWYSFLSVRRFMKASASGVGAWCAKLPRS